MKILKTKKLVKQNGFTMVEMLIYMAILSVLLVSLTEMFVSIMQVKIDADALSAIEQDSQFVYARMVYDINRADSISTPASPGQTASTFSLVIAGETYTYSINGSNELELTTNSGTFKLNSSETEVSDLETRKIGPIDKNTIKVNFTVTSKAITETGAEEKDISFTAGIR